MSYWFVLFYMFISNINLANTIEPGGIVRNEHGEAFLNRNGFSMYNDPAPYNFVHYDPQWQFNGAMGKAEGTVFSGCAFLQSPEDPETFFYSGFCPQFNSPMNYYDYSDKFTFNSIQVQGLSSPIAKHGGMYKFFADFIVYDKDDEQKFITIGAHFMTVDIIDEGNYMTNVRYAMLPSFPYKDLYFTRWFSLAINLEDNKIYYHGSHPFINSQETANYDILDVTQDSTFKNIWFISGSPVNFAIMQKENNELIYIRKYSPLLFLEDTTTLFNLTSIPDAISYDLYTTGSMGVVKEPIEAVFSNGLSVCYTTKPNKEAYCAFVDIPQSQTIKYSFNKINFIKNIKKIEIFGNNSALLLTEEGNVFLYGTNMFYESSRFNKSFYEIPVLITTNIRDIYVSKGKFVPNENVYFLTGEGIIQSPFINEVYWFYSHPNFYAQTEMNYYDSFFQLPNVMGNDKITITKIGGVGVIAHSTERETYPLSNFYHDSIGFNTWTKYNLVGNFKNYISSILHENTKENTEKITIFLPRTKITVRPQDLSSEATKFVKVRIQNEQAAFLTNNGVLGVYGLNNGIYGNGSMLSDYGRVFSIGTNIKDFALTSTGTLCYIKNDNKVYCSGFNNEYQCGRGNNFHSLHYEPVRNTVNEEHTAISIYAQNNGFCTTDSNGAVFCWGENSKKQFCDSGDILQYATYIIGITSFNLSENLYSENNFLYALDPNQSVYACGDNTYFRVCSSNQQLLGSWTQCKFENLYLQEIKESDKSMCMIQNGNIQCYGKIATSLYTPHNLEKYNHNIPVAFYDMNTLRFEPYNESINYMALTDGFFSFINNNGFVHVIGFEPNGPYSNCTNRLCVLDEKNEYLQQVSAIKANKNNFCVLSVETGSIFCNGSNKYGQINSVNHNGHVKVMSPIMLDKNNILTNVYNFSIGDGYMAATYKNKLFPYKNKLFLWGNNTKRKLISNNNSFVKYPQTDTPFSNFLALDSSDNHICYLDSSTLEGKIFYNIICRGDNNYGQTTVSDIALQKEFVTVYGIVRNLSNPFRLENIYTFPNRTCFTKRQVDYPYQTETFCSGYNADNFITNENLPIINKFTNLGITNQLWKPIITKNLICYVDWVNESRICRGKSPFTTVIEHTSLFTNNGTPPGGINIVW